MIAQKIYTGIGSRQTPPDVLAEMRVIGRMLAIKGWLLRSGGAQGADSAFEYGCDEGFGSKEIYTPWWGFNGNRSRSCRPSERAFEEAAQYHPKWQFLKYAVKLLHARNVHQVLGADCESPGQLLICWTPNGKAVGGTATALRIAQEFEIPIVNLFTVRDFNPSEV